MINKFNYLHFHPVGVRDGNKLNTLIICKKNVSVEIYSKSGVVQKKKS